MAKRQGGQWCYCAFAPSPTSCRLMLTTKLSLSGILFLAICSCVFFWTWVWRRCVARSRCRSFESDADPDSLFADENRYSTIQHECRHGHTLVQRPPLPCCSYKPLCLPSARKSPPLDLPLSEPLALVALKPVLSLRLSEAQLDTRIKQTPSTAFRHRSNYSARLKTNPPGTEPLASPRERAFALRACGSSTLASPPAAAPRNRPSKQARTSPSTRWPGCGACSCRCQSAPRVSDPKRQRRDMRRHTTV